MTFVLAISNEINSLSVAFSTFVFAVAIASWRGKTFYIVYKSKRLQEIENLKANTMKHY